MRTSRELAQSININGFNLSIVFFRRFPTTLVHPCSVVVHLPGLVARPQGRVQERSEVKPVVVGRVVRCMVRRRERRSLVPVDIVIVVEVFDFLGHLRRAQGGTPFVAESQEHREWTEFGGLAERAEDGELAVGHAHLVSRKDKDGQ